MKKVLKSLYSFIPFKPQIFKVVRALFHPEEPIYQHLHFKGVFKVPVKKDVSFLMKHYGYQVENDIFWKGLTGKWEKTSIELWMKLSEKSKVIMDIGANTGVYSLISKAVNSNSRVLAFEPISRVFKKLQHNIQLNNFDIETYPEAVSDHNGEITFYDTDDEHPYTATINKELSHNDSYFPVKINAITVDEIIKKRNLDDVDLIKIDVEYHEPEVLKGFSLVSKYHPSILIEILSEDIGRRVQKEIEGYGANYLYFDINEEKGAHLVECIGKSSGMNYLLCTKETAGALKLI